MTTLQKQIKQIRLNRENRIIFCRSCNFTPINFYISKHD